MRISTTVLTFAFILALAAFGFGLVLHALTYAGVDARAFMPSVWYSYQLATALLFIPIMISAHRETEKIPRKLPAPNFLLVCCVFFTLYAFFNWLFTNEYLNHGSTPEILNGQYVMIAHGMASPITPAEYLKHRAYEARANSGHWMTLWSWAAIWLFDHVVNRTELLQHTANLKSRVSGKTV